jgi:hypothetical protein
MQRVSNSDSTFPQNAPAQSINSVHEKETEASRKTNDQLAWHQRKQNAWRQAISIRQALNC